MLSMVSFRLGRSLIMEAAMGGELMGGSEPLSDMEQRRPRTDRKGYGVEQGRKARVTVGGRRLGLVGENAVHALPALQSKSGND